MPQVPPSTFFNFNLNPVPKKEHPRKPESSADVSQNQNGRTSFSARRVAVPRERMPAGRAFASRCPRGGNPDPIWRRWFLQFGRLPFQVIVLRDNAADGRGNLATRRQLLPFHAGKTEGPTRNRSPGASEAIRSDGRRAGLAH